MSEGEDESAQSRFGFTLFTRDDYFSYFRRAAEAWIERNDEGPDIGCWHQELHSLLGKSCWNVQSATRLELPIRPERKPERDAKLLFVAGMLDECGKLRLTLLADLLHDKCTDAQFEEGVSILNGIGVSLLQLINVFSDAPGR